MAAQRHPSRVAKSQLPVVRWLQAGAVATGMGLGLALASAPAAAADEGASSTASESTTKASQRASSAGKAADRAAPPARRGPAASNSVTDGSAAATRAQVSPAAGRASAAVRQRPAAAAAVTVPDMEIAATAVPTAGAEDLPRNAAAPTNKSARLTLDGRGGSSVARSSATSSAVIAGLSNPTLRRDPTAAELQSEQRVPAPQGDLRAAPSIASMNSAVTRFFEETSKRLSTLPGGPAADLLQGALLLVRRTLFNQLPTANPVRYLTTVGGDIVGTLGLTDPELDTPTYSLSRAPEYGTVQIAEDGTYTYTPRADDHGTDTFTVTVYNPGFNVFDPFGSRTTNVTVQIPSTYRVGTPVGLSRGWNLWNLTPYTLKLTDIQKERGYENAVEGAPPIGTLLKPGEGVHFELTRYLFYSYDTRVVFRACLNSDCSKIAPDVQGSQWWTVRLHMDYEDSGGLTGGPLSTSTAERGYLFLYPQTQTNAMIEAPGTTRTFSSGDPNAAAFLNALIAINSDGRKDKFPNTVALNNVQYNDLPSDESDYKRYIAADNPGDGTPSIKQSVSDSYSTTKGSNWTVSPGVTWKPIKDVLEFSVAAQYGKSTSETTSKTFTAEVSQTGLPWSANEILTAPPKMLVNGDAVITFAAEISSTPDDPNRYLASNSYTFKDVQYYFPSQINNKDLWVMRSEPLSGKVNEVPIPNQGFTVKDKTSAFLSPTYKVGQRSQLTAEAYNGAVDKTLLTTYSSSNPAVAVVDATGALSAVGAGTALITARYDWKIPIGGGEFRKDYVIATMPVTVVRK